MANTLAARRDRRGHIVCVLLALLCARPASAAPGQYKAIRFDVAAAAARGDLDVTERMTFQFQTGTYTFVWRDIPAERTDGIEVLGAAMDDVALTAGAGPGHYSVSGRTHVRVEWRFAETGPSTHRFELHYLARGVVYRDGGRDVVRWRALPAEHRYRIDASRIRFEPGAAEVLPLDARHVASATAHEAADAVTVEAYGIAPNGSVTAELRYPAGGLIDTDPAWRSREAAARRFAPRWAIGGAAAFGAALLIVLVALRAYPAPATFPSEAPATEPPQALPAALASVLAAKGRASGYHPLGTLLDLADRGVLVVKETPGRIAGRRYELSQVSGTHDLAAHEEAALRVAFAHRGEDVPLARARARLARTSRQFAGAVNEDLLAHGWLDPDRTAARDRLRAVGLTLLFAGMLGCVAAAPLIPSYDAWPFFLPLGAIVSAIVGLVLGASLTPLSDEGLVEAARWRGFKRHLKWLALRDGDAAGAVPSRWIVYALSFGLGPSWARYLKRHPGIAPAWFVSGDGTDSAAFAAFVGSGSTGGGAAGSAAAAGGGGSGAG
jgi:hypothetical protein